MKKTHKVVMLPTEKAPIKGDLLITLLGKLKVSEIDIIKATKEYKTQHLYILSDDEIKEGDWYLYFDLKGVSLFPMKFDDKNQPDDLDKKIVATTDNSLSLFKDLTGKGLHTIECGKLPQLNESFIQAFIKAYNEGKPITEVDLEMVATIPNNLPKDTSGKTVSFDAIYALKTRPDNTVIVHQSKMYSRDEVIKLFGKFYKDHDIVSIVFLNKWIKDNL